MGAISRRVLIVEDDAFFASLVKRVLTEAGFEVDVAADAARARKKVTSFDPDAVLLDLALGDGPSGIHLAHALSSKRPDIAVLVLSKYSDAKSLSSQAQELPTSVGFIRKQLIADPDELVSAIEKVLADRSYEIRHDKQSRAPFDSLPSRGFEVLRLLAESFSNQEIAARTGLSVKSVERWIDRIYTELQIETGGSINPRVAAAAKYRKATGATD